MVGALAQLPGVPLEQVMAIVSCLWGSIQGKIAPPAYQAGGRAAGTVTHFSGGADEQAAGSAGSRLYNSLVKSTSPFMFPLWEMYGVGSGSGTATSLPLDTSLTRRPVSGAAVASASASSGTGSSCAMRSALLGVAQYMPVSAVQSLSDSVWGIVSLNKEGGAGVEGSSSLRHAMLHCVVKWGMAQKLFETVTASFSGVGQDTEATAATAGGGGKKRGKATFSNLKGGGGIFAPVAEVATAEKRSGLDYVNIVMATPALRDACFAATSAAASSGGRGGSRYVLFASKFCPQLTLRI